MKISKCEEAFALRWTKKIKAIELLGGKCFKCGLNNPVVLSFHHINPSEKKFTIGESRTKRWSEIKEEVEKCVLLCHNCHSELHFKNARNGQLSTEFYKKMNISHCSKCNYKGKNVASLSFHHINPKDKKFSISEYRYRRKKKITKQELETEIKKCIVLCKNCHSLEHFNFEQKKKLEMIIQNKFESYREIQPKLDRQLIKKLILKGEKQIDIAKKLKASKGTISGIVKEIGLNKERIAYSNEIVCPSCNKPFTATRRITKFCSRSCAAQKVKKPDDDVLLELLKNNSYSDIGKMYNVSGVSVYNWVNKLNKISK